MWKIEVFIEEDTRYKKHCTQDNDASVPFKVGTLGPHTVLPVANSCPIVFSWISLTVWNLLPFKVILFWGKARSCRAPNLGVGVLSHLGDLMIHEKMLLETCCMSRHLVVMKLPSQLSIAVAFWMSQVVSTEECSSLKQNLMLIHCSTFSVILNVKATQYTGSLNVIYRPHWLVQWGRHCSHMSIPVHSPWLPGYINVLQTVLINNSWTFSGQTSCI